jgi:hypothetical protein
MSRNLSLPLVFRLKVWTRFSSFGASVLIWSSWRAAITTIHCAVFSICVVPWMCGWGNRRPATRYPDSGFARYARRNSSQCGVMCAAVERWGRSAWLHCSPWCTFCSLCQGFSLKSQTSSNAAVTVLSCKSKTLLCAVWATGMQFNKSTHTHTHTSSLHILALVLYFLLVCSLSVSSFLTSVFLPYSFPLVHVDAALWCRVMIQSHENGPG